MLSTVTSLQLPLNSHTQKPASQKLTTQLLHNFSSPFELKQLHAHLIKTRTPLTSLPLTRIASVCSLNPSFSYAQKLFKHLDNSEIAAWNSCLKAFAEGDDPIDAIMLFCQLQSFNVLPDSFTLSFVLKACTRLMDVYNGRVLHGHVEKVGFQSNSFLMNMILNLYALCGEVHDARLVFDQMPLRDVVTWNIMMTQLVKKGDIDGAYDLFLRMPSRNVRSWTLIISGFVQCGKPKEGISLFLEMEEAGVRPNEVTVVAALAACADLGDLGLGRRIHEYSSQSGFSTNVRISNTLIEMYVKCGCLRDACSVFDAMKEQTVGSWSAMIAGLAMHGQAEEALILFSKMIQIGMKPNDVTFVGLLHACSHIGFVDQGREFFTSMTNDYGIVPRIEHYGCMVDLLSRAGLLQEAYEFITNMRIKPNSVVWGALLGGCKVHRNIELTEEATKYLTELDPLNDGYYVVLSNIYAESQRWEDTARVRKLMRDRGVKKTPGWSSITVNGVIHEFVAGDEAHPQAQEINQMWEKLVEKLKLNGYVPNTSVVLLDMEVDQKEKFLYRHSEKLALVFGLMNTEPRAPIRIMKNLYVCEDCHAAFKLISAIIKREIVVRDRNRFHCFKDGSCSCRNYWNPNDEEDEGLGVLQRDDCADGPSELSPLILNNGWESTLNRLSKWILAGLFAVVILWRHDVEAVWAAMGAVTNSMLSVTLKRILNQERPVASLRSEPGMPSSHAQSIFYIVMFTIWSIVEWLGINEITVTVGVFALAFGTYLSWLRVSQQLHTLSQVIVGATIGTLFCFIWFWSWNAFLQKAFVSSLWVRIVVALGAVGFCLGFVVHVILHWFRDER